MKKEVQMLPLIFIFFALLSACGTNGDSGQSNTPAKANTAYFSSVEVIYDLSDEGRTATEIVIPAQTKEIWLNISGHESMRSFSFEGEDTIIGELSLVDCPLLETVTLPTNMTYIPTLSGCASLNTVSFPETITSVAENAFNGCVSMKALSLPDTVVEIGSRAFYDCSFEQFSIPPFVSVIQNSTFSQCKSLTSIEIPEGVESIGPTAFAFCDALSEVYLPESVAEVAVDAFLKSEGVPMTIYVKEGSWADANFDVFGYQAEKQFYEN